LSAVHELGVPFGKQHAPTMHTCGAAHTVPHWPQLAGSVSRFVQAPLQSNKPLGHVIWLGTQAPCWQTPLPPVRKVQAVPAPAARH